MSDLLGSSSACCVGQSHPDSVGIEGLVFGFVRAVQDGWMSEDEARERWLVVEDRVDGWCVPGTAWSIAMREVAGEGDCGDVEVWWDRVVRCARWFTPGLVG